VVAPSTTLLEIAALMATENTAIVAVVEHGRTLGAVGARALLTAVLPR
jgi:CBS domain-containing protein